MKSTLFKKLAFSCVLALLVTFSMPPALAQQQEQAQLDSLINVLAGVRQDTSRVTLLNNIANRYSTINTDEGIRYASAALVLAGTLNWDKGTANAYNVLGINYYYKSDNVQSLAHWQKALNLFKRLGDKKGILRIIGNIGAVHGSEGNYARALENYFQALKYAEDMDDRNSIAINLGNIGSAYEYLKNYSKALEYDLKAVALFNELGNKHSVALFLGNIGNVYYGQKEYGAAIQYADSALKLDEALGNKEGIARDLVNLGGVHTARRDYGHAFDCYFKALAASREAGFKVVESTTLSYIGETLLAVLKDSAKSHQIPSVQLRNAAWRLPSGKEALLAAAIGYLKQSIAIDTAINNLDQLQHNYQTLSEAEAAAGHFRAALESHRQFTLIKDSLFSAENHIRIANLETQREIDLKDKQIIIDRLEIAKKRNERLLFGAGFALLLAVVVIVIRNIRLTAAKEASEHKLNAFQARMNPHFIFNSLSSIQSLILNNETESSIDYLSEFSTLMRQILDNSALSKVPLKTEIDMLRSYIELEHLRFDGFDRTITIAEDLTPEALYVPGMIIQPFVENAILHGLVSKGKEGRLAVTFGRDGAHVVCTVEDNGVGRERSAEINRKRNRSRQSHGTAIATARLTLLADKKKGLLNKVVYIDKMKDGVAAGTKVIIQLPIL